MWMARLVVTEARCLDQHWQHRTRMVCFLACTSSLAGRCWEVAVATMMQQAATHLVGAIQRIKGDLHYSWFVRDTAALGMTASCSPERRGGINGYISIVIAVKECDYDACCHRYEAAMCTQCFVCLLDQNRSWLWMISCLQFFAS